GEITDAQYDVLRRHVLWGTPLPEAVESLAAGEPAPPPPPYTGPPSGSIPATPYTGPPSGSVPAVPPWGQPGWPTPAQVPPIPPASSPGWGSESWWHADQPPPDPHDLGRGR